MASNSTDEVLAPELAPDVVFLSSIFNQVKIAEPMGIAILTAALREHGFSVDVREPSVFGWTIEKTVTEVINSRARIVGISMLRDKNVDDVLRFCSELRRRGSRQFVIIGGHGPSLTLSGIPDGVDVYEYMASDERPPQDDTCSTAQSKRVEVPGGRTVLPLFPVKTGAIIEPEVSGRGQGPGAITLERPGHSTYYDVSREYLSILTRVDGFMIGEADVTFPELVGRVLRDEPYFDIPGFVHMDDEGKFRKNPTPVKIVDINVLPHMARDTFEKYRTIYNDVPASILASRGCFYRCTFCSVVKYERLQEGLAHRVRGNADLVGEIRELHEQYGCDTFNFEDDNFIVKNKIGRQRLHDLCDDLIALPFPIKFSFFCRADAVDADLFEHLKRAGLSGIYLGIESVYPGDLEFFHKGVKVEQMYEALDALNSLGYSAGVDAELRLMLGYITWHPKTSYASLRETAKFLRRYDAPPKLLRRKLRLYAGTEVLTDVEQMGLLAPEHPDGWNFSESHLAGLDDVVNELFAMVNRRRDMLRTLEKAESRHGYIVPEVERATALRQRLDSFLIDSFDALCATSEASADGGQSREVRGELEHLESEYRDLVDAESVDSLIREGYEACGFDSGAVDLFRK